MARRRRVRETVRQGGSSVHQAAALEAMARELFPLVEQMLDRLGVQGIGPDGQIRAVLLAVGDKLIARALEKRAGQEGPRHPCPGCGAMAGRKQRRPRRALTVGGWVSYERSEYECGCGRVFAPLDDLLGLSPGTECSAALRELMSFVHAEETVEMTAATLGKLLGFPMAPSIVDRAAQIEGARAEGKQDESPARPTQAGPGPRTVLVEMDGCEVLHRDGWHETKVAVVADAEARIEKPPSAGEILRAKRERREPRGRQVLTEKSYVADARSLESFKGRVWRECERQGIERAERIVALGDGAVWIWNLAGELFRMPAGDRGDRPPPVLIEIVDWYHAMEHVWTATEHVHGTRETPEARRWVARWEKRLWKRGDVRGLCRALREKARSRRGAAHKGLLVEAEYFARNAHRMRYPEFRRAGLPVGSGPVESACKNVVQVRCKRTGQRWTRDGLSHVLALRTYRLNERWSELWPEAA